MLPPTVEGTDALHPPPLPPSSSVPDPSTSLPVPSTLRPGSESPLAHPQAYEPDYATSDLEAKKDALVHDNIPYTRQIPCDVFLQSVLPELHPDIDLDVVLDHLRSKHVIEGDRFASFPENPVKILRHEDPAFDELELLVNDLAASKKNQHNHPIPATVSFHHSGTTVPATTIRSNYTRPDAWARLLASQAAGKLHWVDLGFVGEVKKACTARARWDVS